MIDCKYSKIQYKKAIIETDNPSDLNSLKKTLTNIVYSDIVKNLTLLEKQNLILSKKLKITVASEVLNHKAASPMDIALIKIAYEKELSKSILEKTTGGVMDIIQPFLLKKLNDTDIVFLKRLMPFLKKEMPQMANLFKSKIDKRVVTGKLKNFSISYEKNLEELKFLKLLKFLIKSDNKLINKLIIYLK